MSEWQFTYLLLRKKNTNEIVPNATLLGNSTFVNAGTNGKVCVFIVFLFLKITNFRTKRGNQKRKCPLTFSYDDCELKLSIKKNQLIFNQIKEKPNTCTTGLLSRLQTESLRQNVIMLSPSQLYIEVATTVSWFHLFIAKFFRRVNKYI